jgi:hypothetical protein
VIGALCRLARWQQGLLRAGQAEDHEDRAGRPQARSSYIFVSTRPADNVKNEVSVIIGYPFKTSSDATAEVGAVKFAMYTQNDGAWIKNVAEEARMVDAMRKGADLTVKGTSGRGTASTDQYSLKGLRRRSRKSSRSASRALCRCSVYCRWTASSARCAYELAISVALGRLRQRRGESVSAYADCKFATS